MAYTTATFIRLEPNADGSSSIVLVYTGNAGELPVEYRYPIDASTMPDADYMRRLAMQRIATLNNNQNFKTGALPFVGTILDTSTPLPTTSSTFGEFVAATAPFTPGATPQDIFTITPGAKTVRVTRIGLSAVQTTAGMNAVDLVERSTANSNGTSATVTAVPTDPAYPAATATVRQYTVNPTLGNLVGSIWSGRLATTAPATAPGDCECAWPEDGSRGLSLVLSGTRILAWNLRGVALPAGLSVQATVRWQES